MQASALIITFRDYMVLGIAISSLLFSLLAYAYILKSMAKKSKRRLALLMFFVFFAAMTFASHKWWHIKPLKFELIRVW